MSNSALPQGATARASPRGSLIELAIVICLAACAGAAFEAWRPATPPGLDKPAESPASAPAQSSTIVDLPPIVTNLGAPQDTWIRLEGSLIFDPKALPHPEAVAAQIGDDILAYLRTVSLRQLEGPIGLENIRQDLNERAGDPQRRQGARVRDPNIGGAMKRAICAGVALLAASCPTAAQSVDLNSLVPAGGATASARIIELVAILTVLSVAPGLLIMVTSFTRFIVALSFLRSGLGLQSAPANLVLISLALFMTFFVMAPTFDQAWQKGLKPLMDNQISQQDALAAVSEPFREFMLAQVREKDMALFEGLSKGRFEVTDRSKADLRLLIPAFMISELRRGFEIGFLIVLPFLVIDMIVATLTMSMGMMMLPPSVISLPVKILFFVLIDGWNLLIGSLVRSAS
jgi:flagellar biosynthetic protein FliP